MRKKILFCTNSRSELTTVLSMFASAKSSDLLQPMLMVGGTHFSALYGSTYKAVLKQKINIDYRADYYKDNQSLEENLGDALVSFVSGLRFLKPDVVVVTGDRIECLPLVTACLLSDQTIAHVSGGDTTLGAFDNQIRDMLTKSSHLHFVAMEEHAIKVKGLGEASESIFITGDPAIDVIIQDWYSEGDTDSCYPELIKKSPYILCTFHPQTIESENNDLILGNMLRALELVAEFKLFTYPNGDPGSEKIIDKIENFVAKNEKSAIVKSLNGTDYYRVFANAKLVIGNSSSPLWEGPTLKIPAVNIGIRQSGRVRAGNVVDVDGKNVIDISRAIQKAGSPDFGHKMETIKNPYGDGRSSQKIVDVLELLNLEEVRSQKVQGN